MHPVVHTRYGSVRGTLGPSGIAAFKGVPYAIPPLGELRFRPPLPPRPWNGVRDAVDYGPTAPKSPYAPPFDQLIPEVDIPGEDFLNLNVWTPDPAGRLPVMVWLHGGAFANGSGSAPCYDGTAFARDGVVLVTLNYRLGVEGFLHLATDHSEATANLGLLDQIAALEWVRDNIGGFGGDPEAVTVFGESAGAMSIGTLLAMPAARGLFHRAVLQSGAAHHTLSPTSAALVGNRLAQILGVPPTRAAIGEVPPKRLLPAQQRLRAEISARPDPRLWGEAVHNLMPFEPVVDGRTLPTPPVDAIDAGAAAGIDVLVGTNRDEYRLFLVPTGMSALVGEEMLERAATGYGLKPVEGVAAYRAAFEEASPGLLLAEIATDWFYRIPALRLADAQSRHGARAYVYEFAWQPPTFDGQLGACHASELPFVFDALDDPAFVGLLGPHPPQQVADAMHAAWVAFATAGDPGWPRYDADRPVMRFGGATGFPAAVETDPRGALRTSWDGVR
ncbi:carboxylesterase/lipase family protein [Streptomyces tropicalis]|uniref:Carboxylic ester hydrolase n=1 Tax=Streptomyces tropicalis TaxID=3034234 RepID=A0ABT6A666_9ACTN|nr:carboxylesterase family protein [Streptomyces tropicalis]MDF3300136.1 carboxylesterase family protein [Streptomyces tropicalis]